MGYFIPKNHIREHNKYHGAHTYVRGTPPEFSGPLRGLQRILHIRYLHSPGGGGGVASPVGLHCGRIINKTHEKVWWSKLVLQYLRKEMQILNTIQYCELSATDFYELHIGIATSIMPARQKGPFLAQHIWRTLASPIPDAMQSPLASPDPKQHHFAIRERQGKPLTSCRWSTSGRTREKILCWIGIPNPLVFTKEYKKIA